jgi:hypothetical protein
MPAMRTTMVHTAKANNVQSGIDIFVSGLRVVVGRWSTETAPRAV